MTLRKLTKAETEALLTELADTSYEWRDRMAIKKRDWARIHTLADRRAPIILPDNHKRTWRA